MILSIRRRQTKDTPSQSIEPVWMSLMLNMIQKMSPKKMKTFIAYKRPKKYFTKEDIVIEGCLNIAELVDFLINQKDRHSYAILPEIYSPGPLFMEL